ncbi:ribose 1,5-bisphosphate isomerase [Methanoculleus bourgensis]|jgi:ribose 1,5-bisphosphate isomerase|uniref:Ribose 1,5-bisphosphate isomerase n=1 Tax=Methanoculleus bourgensis TaxID=83986 RepID=A0A0X3BN23_9EURY|nr:ribose 1,5-bisphosphate isomerase [Methanoculleus bourgensis]CVK33289.1 putative translation initiation factor eIF-2B subunit 2 [Methanoculleus bourgensis]SAI89020.1 translation initiation factor eIF-2B delta subunit [Methanoculleus bourgensis]
MLLSETAENIKKMEIRGAGRIARAAVEALADFARNLDVSDPEVFKQEMQGAARTLISTRPTAVSLPNAVKYVMRALDSFESVEAAREATLSRAAEFIEHSEHAVEWIAEIGARHISDGDVLLTHCNSEAALGCILEAHRQGKEIEVYATEVRPRGQGLITIRTLNEAGIRTNYIIDSAVRYFINDVDLVIVGADAIAVNGAVVNKIGTAQIAHAANEARTNVIVAAETYKFAPRTILGEKIEIEERDPAEVLPREEAERLPFVRVRNPAFDVTPAEYIDLIITERGAIPPELAYTVIRDYLGWRIEEFR